MNPAAKYGTVSIDVVFDNVSAANPATTQVWARGEETFSFFFFDLASCIQKEDAPLEPPPPDPK